MTRHELWLIFFAKSSTRRDLISLAILKELKRLLTNPPFRLLVCLADKIKLAKTLENSVNYRLSISTSAQLNNETAASKARPASNLENKTADGHGAGRFKYFFQKMDIHYIYSHNSGLE